MSAIWDARNYDAARRRLVPCFDQFYGTAVELVACSAPRNPRILDLGAGTGLLAGMVSERVQPQAIHLLDASKAMLDRAQGRLRACRPEILVQQLTDPLPAGPYDAVVSALAIHHLSDEQKRDLFSRIYHVLAPGGIFVNAEQILGVNEWEQRLFETMHIRAARALGSSEEEIAAAQQRMSYDRCARLDVQLQWLRELSFERVSCFFQWFRLAVYAAWKGKSRPSHS